MNPIMFVKKADEMIQENYVAENRFRDFGLETKLENNIAKRGYVNPTAIQDQSIGSILSGRDLVGMADTGSGKTAAFLIPLVNKMLLNREERGLVIIPTRELAQQIKDEWLIFTQETGLRAVLCIGGVSLKRQIDQLWQRPQLVIGTPGRIKDLSERGKLKLGEYNNVVLDEVDRMLDMGFVRDIREMIGKLSQERQSLFFSATIPDHLGKKGVALTFVN